MSAGHGGPDLTGDRDAYTLRDYLDIRFHAIEERLDRIEHATPQAGAFGAIGSLLGAFVMGMVDFFIVPRGR